MQLRSVLFAALSLGLLPPAALAQAALELFNGKDLSGWVQRGGKASYAVENGEIVGRSVAGTPNTFLCTEKDYGDFVLEYEFKVDPQLNSGVQIRSQVFDHETSFVTPEKTIKIAAGRVHGYQIEIDVNPKQDRWWTAGIYDEGRRGWLFPALRGSPAAVAFTDQGRAVTKPDEWNHVRVVASGDSLKTWLNGEPRADLKDSVTPAGFIALQVHSIGDKPELAGSTVRWRNLRLTPLSAPSAPEAAPLNTLSDAERAAGWRLLWDGATPNGWRSAKADTFPTGGWTMAGGILSVVAAGGAESRNGGDIITRERFSDFELTFDFKLSAGANSGVKYFVQPSLPAIGPDGKPVAVGSAIGLEYQLLDDVRHPDAKLGRDGNRTLGSLYDLIAASAAKQPNPIGEWNSARLLVKGAKIEHWLNGTCILAYERGTPAFREAVAASKYKHIAGFGEWPEGHILLQDHGDAVSYRNIKIRVPVAP
jgi:hypothetical protein